MSATGVSCAQRSPPVHTVGVVTGPLPLSDLSTRGLIRDPDASQAGGIKDESADNGLISTQAADDAVMNTGGNTLEPGLGAGAGEPPPELSAGCDDSARPFVFPQPLEAPAAGPAPDPDALPSQSTPPEGELAEPVLVTGAEKVPEELGAGLKQVSMSPFDEIAPVPSGAIGSATELNASGIRPARSARGSSGSNEVRVGVWACGRVTGMASAGRDRGGYPSRQIHRRRGMQSCQEIGLEGATPIDQSGSDAPPLQSSIDPTNVPAFSPSPTAASSSTASRQRSSSSSRMSDGARQ